MKINKMLVFSFILSVSGLPVMAVTPGDIQSDSKLFAKWFSQELAHVTAFNAFSGPQMPGEVHSLLGVELGLSAVVSSSKLDLDGYKNLPWKELQPEGFDMPADIMMAIPMVHAKVGLPFSLDLGLKYGRISFNNTDNDATSDVTNTVFGVEIRRRLMGEGVTGVVIPDVALSLGYDQANGDATRTENYTGPVSGGTLIAASSVKSEWQTGAISARVVASKQFLIVTPYIGAGYSRLMGDANTTVNITETGSSLGVGSVSANDSAQADDDIVQFLGGIEFTFIPMVKLNLGGLYSADDWGATAGLRFTFR